MRAQHLVEACRQLVLLGARMVEQHQALALPQPLEHRHRLLEGDERRGPDADSAGHVGISDGQQDAVTYGAWGWARRGQSQAILAEPTLSSG